MGHSLHNRIQTKPAISAGRIRALACATGLVSVVVIWLAIHLTS